MKRLLSAILCAAVLAVFPLGGAWAESPETFEFPGGITWDSTPEEVEAILGEASERSVSDASDESYIIVTTQLLYRDGEFFGFPVIGASFLFGERNYGGYMQSILCQYDMEAVGDIGTLIDALTMLYGEPDSEEDQYELIRWNREGDSQEVVHSWTLPDGSLIVLYDIVKDESHRCSVACTNLEALTRAAFLQLWDRPAK